MLIKQLYTNCLAQAAYYIESDGEAVVIDPLRDIAPYLKLAAENKARIKYVFETHFHADFVSGHLDLARATGANIVYGPTAAPDFNALVAQDGDTFIVGDVRFRLLHTPGHTMESCCYLLIDEKEKPVALFSGDTLFLGDVGRPDLAQEAAKMTKEELAGLLYDSLQKSILTLPDGVIIYAGHGAGSACGKNMSADKSDTLGHQKAANYALRSGISREEFIQEVTSGLPKPPQYFPYDVQLNKKGYTEIDAVLKQGSRALTANDFKEMGENTRALILDTRNPDVFASAFVPGSINVGIDGDFAPWVGTVVTGIKQPILIVCDEDRIEEVVTRLARVGYDYSLGYLSGGIADWQKAGYVTDSLQSITAEELADRLDEKPGGLLLDARRNAEFELEHVTGAINTPLDELLDILPTFDKYTCYYVYCAGGYRSMIFASILKSKGFNNIINVQGGFKSIKENGRLFLSTGKEHLDLSMQ